MKSLLFFVFLSISVSAQQIFPIIYNNQSLPTSIVSSVVENSGSIYACQLSGTSYGDFNQLIISKYDSNHNLVLEKSMDSPVGTLISCHLITSPAGLWLIGAYRQEKTNTSGILWTSLNGNLELEDLLFQETGPYYAEQFSISTDANRTLIAGTLSTSPFVHKPFMLLLNDQMHVIDFHMTHEDAYDVESALLFDDYYLLLGAGIWKYDYNHVLLDALLFESPNEVARTKSLKMGADVFFTLRRTFGWESGDWSLLLEKWNTDLQLAGALILESENMIEDMNKFGALGRLSENKIVVSAYAFEDKMNFPFVQSPSSLLLWKISNDLEVSHHGAFVFKDFHYPYAACFNEEQTYIAGFFVETVQKLSPFLFRFNKKSPLPVLEIGPYDKLDFIKSEQEK